MKRTTHVLAALTVVCAPLRGAAQSDGEAAPTEPSRKERSDSESSGDDSVGGITPEAVTDAPSTLPDDVKVRRARDHFKRGVTLYREGDYDGALGDFTRAYELSPNYRILYNLGQTYVERHDYVTAVKLLGEYLEQGGSEIPAPRRQATERERERLAERTATVDVDGNVDGAELFINGQSQGLISRRRSIRLNPGVSRLRLEKRGYDPVNRELTLAGGDALALELQLEAIHGSADIELSDDNANLQGDDAPSRTGLWISVSAAPVLAGAAVTFGVLTAKANRGLSNQLRQLPANARRIDDARSRLRLFAGLTDGFAIATALDVACLIHFLLSSPDRAGSGSSHHSAAGLSGTHLVLRDSRVSVVGVF